VALSDPVFFCLLFPLLCTFSVRLLNIFIAAQVDSAFMSTFGIEMNTEGLPPVSVHPSVKSTLFPYQMTGLSWLIQRESDDRAVLFWQQRQSVRPRRRSLVSRLVLQYRICMLGFAVYIRCISIQVHQMPTSYVRSFRSVDIMHFI
jgi:hypothetical protein